jgi:hypothetical protein
MNLYSQRIGQAIKLLKEAKRIAVFTGVGISIDSGISDLLLMNMSVRKWSKCGLDEGSDKTLAHLKTFTCRCKSLCTKTIEGADFLRKQT